MIPLNINRISMVCNEACNQIILYLVPSGLSSVLSLVGIHDDDDDQYAFTKQDRC
jgi:hypothetical protein